MPRSTMSWHPRDSNAGSSYRSDPSRSGIIGAGEGNRTLVFSLEGCCSTIELHPRSRRQLHGSAAIHIASQLSRTRQSSRASRERLDLTDFAARLQWVRCDIPIDKICRGDLALSRAVG